MNNNRFGLNIGTQNIGISSVGNREVLVEKNVIAVRDGKYVTGYGDEAWEMFEKAPENIEVVFPTENSVISDLEKQQVIFEGLYKKLNNGKLIKGTEFLIAVPTDITEVEKRAFHEMVADSRIRPRSISVIEKSVADAIECGIDPQDPAGSLIVNIGADTTDISVISLGGIVLSKTLKFGGNRFSEMIMSAVKQSEGKLIGFKSAELLKANLADMSINPQEKEMQIFARVIATGLPVRTVITSALVTEAIRESIENICEDVRRILEKSPPELADDINEAGIYLMGGSANLKNIDQMFADNTGLKVNLVREPGYCTIRGVTRVFSNSRYDGVRYFPQEKIYN